MGIAKVVRCYSWALLKFSIAMVCFGALPLARLGRAHAPFKKEIARAREPEPPLEATEHICKIARNNATPKGPGKGEVEPADRGWRG